MGLGRNEKLHISCEFKGRESNCPKQCAKCAIAIKTDGDVALSANRLDDAIKQYKKALFVEPKFAEAWCNLASVYGMKSEYNNALSAFNKALAIDPQYGKAMFGKAVTLKNLGKLDAAMALTNEILELYDDSSVQNLKAELKRAGVRDTAGVYSLQQAIDKMTNKGYEIITTNKLLDKDGKIRLIREIECKVDFASKIYSFCKRRYGSLGNEKIWSESIIAAFYGSAYVTLQYYQTPKAFNGVDPFDYLHDTANLEELDRSTEKLLGIRGDDKASEKVWNVVYPFVTFCKPILEGVEPVTDLDAAVRDATESSYVMGMLLAMRHHDKEEEEENRSALNKSLEKLAESTKDYDYTPPVSNARCYSIAIPDEVPLYFRCDRCGKSTSIQVYAGQEKQIIDKYRSVANEFTQLGYPATVKCYCDQCADQNYPSYNMYRKNNFIFSVSRPDCEKPVNSFPATHSFNDFQYKVALAFLKGADTLPKLSAATDTKLSAQAYLDHVHNVLGNVVTGTGGTSK